MPRPAYPEAEDLAALLAATPLDIPDTLDFDSKVAEARDDWEARTDWLPYLADADDSERTFDPPGWGGSRTLPLGGGLVSLTSLTVDGTALVSGTDFRLRPANAPAQGRPYTSAEFLCGGWGGSHWGGYGPPGSVVIVGRWGRVAALEDNVWGAILGYAASLCVPELALTVSNGLAKIDDATFAGGGVTPLSAEGAQWAARFSRLAELKKRQQVF